MIEFRLTLKMLQKTQGIVLNYIKFKETSIIAKIYTLHFGIQSYIINGLRSKASKKSLALFQPLTILELVVYSKKNENSHDGIKRLSEYRPLTTFRSIPFDIKKSTMAIFISELISKTLKEENGEVFPFLRDSILLLDAQISAYENFHLKIMISLAHHIGFAINEVQDIKVLKSNFIGIEDFDIIIEKLFQLKQSNFEQGIELTNKQRKSILNLLIAYYRSHIEGFSEMKSKIVLQQIFS